MIKILFLAANPEDTTQLRLDKESRLIDQELQKGKFSSGFQIEKHFAVRFDDLSLLLLKHMPNIVHFSGHADLADGIILLDELGNSRTIGIASLRQLFSVLKDNIKCVVLNACYTEQQAKVIAEQIDCVVGIPSTINDECAMRFATAFYRGLVFGRSVKTAFELGLTEMESIAQVPDTDKPRLVSKNVDPAQVVFIGGYTLQTIELTPKDSNVTLSPRNEKSIRKTRKLTNLTGIWEEIIFDEKMNIEKRDRVTCKQTGEVIQAEIERLYPERHAGRRWHFQGRYRGGRIFGHFWSDTPVHLSFGVIYLRSTGGKLSGYYIRSHKMSLSWEHDTVEIKIIPLEWRRLDFQD